MPTINMRSSATLVKGQGVGSCYEEQVKLVSEGLGNEYSVYINKWGVSDIEHYHTVNLNYYIERFFNKNKTAGIGYVHFLPDTLEDSLELPRIIKKLFYKYLLSFYNSMDYLVTVNPLIIKKLEDYGISNPKILYIPNFVSKQYFHEQSEEKKLFTKMKYGIENEKFIVLGAGQLQTRKGIFDFVETAKLLPDVQFVWAGGFSFGKITDGYEQIKTLTENSPKNVKFLGIIEREEMPDIYNIGDVFFLPSFDELFPMTILEAMNCKNPILLRDIDIYKDILFDNYLKATDPYGFAERICDLCYNKESMNQWRKKACECGEIYSEENILNKWSVLYNEAYTMSKIKNKGRELLFSGGKLF